MHEQEASILTEDKPRVASGHRFDVSFAQLEAWLHQAHRTAFSFESASGVDPSEAFASLRMSLVCPASSASDAASSTAQEVIGWERPVILDALSSDDFSSEDFTDCSVVSPETTSSSLATTTGSPS